jgi:uncharacterized protein YjeT (DUF2065 family)
MNSLLAAFGLVLVLEGILPFIAPRLWRDAFRKMIEMNDGQVRFMGLLSMLAGISLVLIVR